MTSPIVVNGLSWIMDSENLLSLAALEGSSGKVPYFSSAGTLALTPSTSFGRGLLNLTDGTALEDLMTGSAFVEGKDYLGAFHNALIAGGPTTILVSGDSTVRGTPYTTPPYAPKTLIANFLRRQGITNITTITKGYSGETTADWIASRLTTDLATPCDLYIWHWSLNDPIWASIGGEELSPEQTRDNLREGLTAYRDLYPRDTTSIVLLTPNFSDWVEGGKSPEWFATVNQYIREAAADFECCFIDIYTPWRHADSSMMWGAEVALIHPGAGYSVQSWSLVMDSIIPLVLRRPVAPITADLVKQRWVRESTWLPSSSGAARSWRGVIWAKEFASLVAVSATGTGQRAATSPDGVTWTLQTTPDADNWQEIAYSPKLRRLVAVSYLGGGYGVMTSDDGGVTWTGRNPPTVAGWVGVSWSPDLELFAAVGENVIMTSPDGITWTNRTSATVFWQSVVWAPEFGMFVTVGSTGTGNRAAYSYDGVTWTQRPTPSDITWTAVEFAPDKGLFVAVANTTGGNNVMTSTDGATWTLRAGHANSFGGVAYYQEIGLFIAVCTSGTGNRVLYSEDGITWTEGESAEDFNWQDVCVAPELGLAVAVAGLGSIGNDIMTSVSACSYPYRS